MSPSTQTTCKRCGTCCINGGPALHADDLPLLKKSLSPHDLVSIRQGEPVFSPISGKVEPASKEIIKLAGTGASWTCCFLKPADNSCLIYHNRPLECRTLKCWAPAELAELIYNDTISRREIVATDHPLLELIGIQARECSFERVAQLMIAHERERETARVEEIRKMVKMDLTIRRQAIQKTGISLAEELFFFGRPLFTSLSYYGLTIQNTPSGMPIIAE